MKKILDWIYNKKYYFYALTLAFLILLFTSKNSFLYAFNDWVDTNAFFTVGKSMMNKVVPYKDLFEQKGLFLYLIYGIGYLLCNKAFYGVFILEVFSFSIFLYYAHKIFSMYLAKKYSLILLPILANLVTTSLAFVHGGSCEEFALPFITISLYYYFKHFKISKLTNKEKLINGIMCGIVFMMKYTMIGFWIGFFLFIFTSYLIKKEVKEALKFLLYFTIGVIIPIGLSFIYLTINHAVKDFIECYFIVNLKAYSDTNKASILFNIKAMIRGVGGSLRKNRNILKYLILLIPLFVLSIRKDNYYFKFKLVKKDIFFKISLLGLILFMILVIYWGLKFFSYYLLPIFIFLIISLLGIALYLNKFIDRVINKKYMYIVFITLNIFFVFLSYNNANYKNMLAMTKKDFFQFKYANYINKYDNPTLLNMGFLDGGLYTTTVIIPNTRFFEVQNLDYKRFPANIDEMKNSVIKREVKFILFYTQVDLEWIKDNNGFIFDNYELVYDDTHYFENAVTMNAFLFKLKDLEK